MCRANEVKTPMDIQQVYTLIDADRRAVDELIQRRLHSDVELINQIGHYIVNSGGKRLRPILLLLMARALNYEGEAHYELAAVVEFIHTATLLHDDVVDASELRRGRQTANAVFGNEASVLVGDFLYSRAFQMMVTLGDMRVMEILAAATNRIAEGEVMQLLNIHDSSTSEARYLEVIRCKTAKLFESATALAAVIANVSRTQQQQLAAFGMHLGVAYQLVDDVLDYSASAEQMGKNIGDDLAEGKPTLPLIYTLQHGSAADAALIRQAIEQGGLDQMEKIQQAIASCGAIDYTFRLAVEEVEKGIATLELLPDSPYREALITVARFAVQRSH